MSALWSETFDPLIQNRMQMLTHPQDYFRFVDPALATSFVKFRCRGVDPWLKVGEEVVRLTSLNPVLEKEFQKTKKQAAEGWHLEIRSP
jgi:hypothetical protein